MKSLFVFIFVYISGLLFTSSAFAGTTQKYSCFTDGYEPGTVIEFSLNETNGRLAPLFSDFRSFNEMPFGPVANLAVYSSNVDTLSVLEDGKIAFTGWDFSKVPAPEATVIVEKNYVSGVFIRRSPNEQVPSIVSITCKKK